MEVILSSNMSLGSGYMSSVECGLPPLVPKKNHLTAEGMRRTTIMKGYLPDTPVGWERLVHWIVGRNSSGFYGSPKLADNKLFTMGDTTPSELKM